MENFKQITTHNNDLVANGAPSTHVLTQQTHFNIVYIKKIIIAVYKVLTICLPLGTSHILPRLTS